ncbi:MAG TPA: hypothetical protein VKV39_04320 [Candidatus Sulfotelmatobacter sp.]|nr:hypothetical protein [Candidatus Sulfotelmatobacter sp.]
MPRTRAVWTPNGLAFKLEGATTAQRERLESDPRIGSTRMQKARWFTFEIFSNQDLHDVLEWLGEAFDAAGKAKKSK